MPAARLRFAPSPTGALHLGSALVALANTLYARGTDGCLVLRIDDTDALRSTDTARGAILEQLQWLGIEWDEGPYRQSERGALYAAHLQQLLKTGAAYHCFCSEERLATLAAKQRADGVAPRYDGMCRTLTYDEVQSRHASGEHSVVRFAVPADTEFGFIDLVHGPIASPPDAFGDFVLQRSDGGYGYIFASSCDDLDLRITHVLRGSDHLPNTARQRAVMQALGARDESDGATVAGADSAQIPQFAHLPLLARSDGRKLAKRDPAGTLAALRREHFTPATVRTYLCELLGQGAVDPLAIGDAHPPAFNFDAVSHGMPHVDEARLASIAREQIQARNIEQLTGDVVEALAQQNALPTFTSEAQLVPFIDDARTNCMSVHQLVDVVAGTLQMRGDAAERDEWTSAQLLGLLDEHALASLDDAQVIIGELRARAKADGRSLRSVLHPLRVMLTGQDRGPDLATVIYALGSGEVRARIAQTVTAGVDDVGNSPTARKR